MRAQRQAAILLIIVVVCVGSCRVGLGAAGLVALTRHNWSSRTLFRRPWP
jgi:hypothetical protein